MQGTNSSVICYNFLMEAEKKNVFLTLISSLLFGSSISLIVTKLLIEKLGLNFVSLVMPGMNEQLAFDKTFDVLDFGMAGVLSLGFFFLNWFGMKFIAKKFRKEELFFPQLLLLIFSVITFMQTHFLLFGAKQVLGMVLGFEVIYFGLVWSRKMFNFSKMGLELKGADGKLKFQNGIFLGFLLLLITNSLTTIPILSLAWLFITPLLFLSSINKKINSVLENIPGMLSIVAILFPTNLILVLGLFLILVAGGFGISKYKPGILLKNWNVLFLSPVFIIFLIAFNPTFYIGNFDSVEEGFWLAWVQGLIGGQVLYKDVAVYHSPLIPWGMYLFSKFNGFNLYSERLFLHLLQIIGISIYFFFTRYITKNTFFAILSSFLFLAATSSILIKNNIEIRLGLSLLSLLFLFVYLRDKKGAFLFFAGVTGVISLMTSIESGLAVIATLLVGLNIFSETKIFAFSRFKENGYLISGVVISLGLFVGYFAMTDSLLPFIEQTSFYAGAFSAGYFNAAMERSVAHSYFQFNMFDQYLDSVTIFWEGTKLTFIGFLIYGIYRFFSKQKFSLETNSVLITALFGLILTRAALGRSDFYHLLFVLGIAFVLVFYALSKLYLTQRMLAFGLVLFLVLVVGRPLINSSLISYQLFKYQTYGKIIGEYKKYDFERGSGILLAIENDTQPVSDLVKYVQSNSSQGDKIFVYPWNPEIYFYTDRAGASKIDTPYAFFSESYQYEMVEELKNNPPKVLIYNGSMNFGNLTIDTLPLVKKYIQENYKTDKSFGSFDAMTLKN